MNLGPFYGVGKGHQGTTMTGETHEGRGLGHAIETKLRVLQRNGVKMAIMCGREDGAPTFSLRQFKVEPGGNTPRHSHGGSRGKDKFIATEGFLEPIGRARRTGNDRFVAQVALEIRSQPVGRFVASGAVFLCAKAGTRIAGASCLGIGNSHSSGLGLCGQVALP